MVPTSFGRGLAVVALVGCVGSSGSSSPSSPDSGSSPPPGEDASVADASAAVDSAAPVDAAPPVPCPIGLDETIAATVAITVDDYRRLYVNGILIDDTKNQWSTPTTHAVTLFRHPSKKNVIAVEGTNSASIAGLDRGILVDATWAGPNDAGLRHVHSDASWRVSATLTAGWFEIAFDDGEFAAAVEEATNGMQPWGSIGVIDPDAKWIWTYDSNKDTAQKPNTEIVYARKAFYLSTAGEVAASPGACP